MDYVRVTLRDEYTDGTPCYIAYHPELPGCMAQGDTPQEARAELESVCPEWIAHLEQDGSSAPAPGSALKRYVQDDGSETVIMSIDRDDLWPR